MEPVSSNFLLKNWPRKGIALFVGIIVWIFVNQSITEIKTLPNVPIRIINLPSDRTIVGLLPNRYISQRITLTLSGARSVIQELEPGDLEIFLDASTAENDQWVPQITKKNLVSLNPNLDLRHYINNVSHSEFVIKLSPMVTEKVPLTIKQPTGSPPEGYEFLSVWPEQLFQTVSGPEEQIQALKVKGLRLTLDLDNITKEELDLLNQQKKPGHDDEISYPVPEKSRIVTIPFRNNLPMEINDPEAKNLRIDFLRKRLLPVGKEIPINVYYPLKYSSIINPNTHTLETSNQVRDKNGIFLLTMPLYVSNVSQLFLDIIRENIEIVIVAAPTSERKILQWSVEIIDPKEMEDTYIAFMNNEQKEAGLQTSTLKTREAILGKRFQEYLQKLALYTADGQRLKIISTLENNKIIVQAE